MASTNKTENFSLNQWVGTDPVLMEDFNADNAKIDAALQSLVSGQLKMAVGSYYGNGTFGASNPSSLSFDFVPSVVIIQKDYYIPLNPTSIRALMIRPMNEIPMELYASGSAANTRPLNITWGDKSVSWWYSGAADYDSHGANWQMNSDGEIYYYAAIGI